MPSRTLAGAGAGAAGWPRRCLYACQARGPPRATPAPARTRKPRRVGQPPEGFMGLLRLRVRIAVVACDGTAGAGGNPGAAAPGGPIPGRGVPGDFDLASLPDDAVEKNSG